MVVELSHTASDVRVCLVLRFWMTKELLDWCETTDVTEGSELTGGSNLRRESGQRKGVSLSLFMRRVVVIKRCGLDVACGCVVVVYEVWAGGGYKVQIAGD